MRVEALESRINSGRDPGSVFQAHAANEADEADEANVAGLRRRASALRLFSIPKKTFDIFAGKEVFHNLLSC